MKRTLYLPYLGEVDFDFMYMKLYENAHVIDNDLRLTFETYSISENHPSICLGIHFNYDEFAIDERFPNYRYTELTSIHKIEVYDHNMEIELDDKSMNQLLLIAKSILPRQYVEIKEVSNLKIAI